MIRSRNKGFQRKPRPRAESNGKKLKIKRSRTSSEGLIKFKGISKTTFINNIFMQNNVKENLIFFLIIKYFFPKRGSILKGLIEIIFGCTSFCISKPARMGGGWRGMVYDRNLDRRWKSRDPDIEQKIICVSGGLRVSILRNGRVGGRAFQIQVKGKE